MAAGSDAIEIVITGRDDSAPAFNNAEKSLGGLVGASDNATRALRRTSDEGFDKATDAADGTEQRILGLRDVFTGLEDLSTAEGPVDYLTGLGDLASGIANFIVPTIANFTKVIVANSVAWIKNAAAWAISMGPLILAVLAVIAVVVLLVKNWDTVREVALSVWKSVTDAVKDAVRKIADFFAPVGPLLEKSFTFVKDAAVAAFDAIKAAFSGILTVVKTVFGGIVAVAKPAFQAVAFTAKVALNLVGYLLGVVYRTGVQVFRGISVIAKASFFAMSVLADSFSAAMRVTFKAISTLATVSFNVIKAVAKPVFAALSVVAKVYLAYLRIVFKIITTVATAAFRALLFVGTPIFNGLLAVAQAVFGAIASVVSVSIDVVLSVLRTIISVGQSVFSGLFNIVSNIFGKIKNTVVSSINFMKKQLRSLVNALSKIPGVGAVRNILGFQHGGITGSGMSTVGERGREIIQGAGRRVVSGPDTERMMRGQQGAGTSVVVNVSGSVISERELVAVVRDELLRGGFGGMN